jgi:hypothetical protein
MSANKGQNARVFISYAREDSQAANRLYNDLKMAGLDPWLDTQSLLAGQNWKRSIKEAITNSRYFIPLLSSNSVEKIGYVQKELKEALEVLDEFPQSKIFVIPVRIDDCSVTDDKLRDLHMVDLYVDWTEGIKRILSSMDLEYKKLDKSSNQQGLTYRYDEWEELLRHIYDRKCCPFIGPEASNRWIPRSDDIAIKLAEEHGYPFDDANQLPQVAQYLAITQDDEMYPKKYLANILRAIPAPNFSLPEYENTIYAVLGDLNLPIYVTTNYDHLMEEALTNRGKDPITEFCRWNPAIIKYTKSAQISFISDDRRYNPTPANPLVFHLNGDMDHPISMVLTEQDYVDFMLNMNNLDAKTFVLPNVIQKSFAVSSQLFMGYSLNDINSRNMFRTIAKFSGAVESPLSITVMHPPVSDHIDNQNSSQTQKYLEKYTKGMFKLNIYWYDLFMFLVELRNGFNTFRKKRSMISR